MYILFTSNAELNLQTEIDCCRERRPCMYILHVLLNLQTKSIVLENVFYLYTFYTF